MSGGIANIVRITAASICLFVILVLSAGSAFAHAGGDPRPAEMATFTADLTAEASAIEFPSPRTPGRECPGGMNCCTPGHCSFQSARLDSGYAFDFEYRIGRQGYPEHSNTGLVGIAAMPSIPPPRLRI